ncbi:MAG TPA: protein-export chaperone SecB [Bauldia sp.]|nr:protein-export chaperone SecB [Bauldia sp.]
MADPVTAVPPVGAQAAPNLNVLTQYVKDFSFENPGAPQSLRMRPGSSPNINISIGVQSAPLGNNEFEVELRIDARATDGQAVMFAIELVYAGVFRFTNIPPEQARAVALIECPRLIFPFARQIVADASRNGGFPPLLIDPVDFVAMYRQQMASEMGQGAGAPN